MTPAAHQDSELKKPNRKGDISNIPRKEGKTSRCGHAAAGAAASARASSTDFLMIVAHLCSHAPPQPGCLPAWALHCSAAVCICRRRFRAPQSVSQSVQLTTLIYLLPPQPPLPPPPPRCPRRRQRWRGSLKTVCSGEREGRREGGQRCGNRVILLPLEQGEGEREEEGRGE